MPLQVWFLKDFLVQAVVEARALEKVEAAERKVWEREEMEREEKEAKKRKEIEEEEARAAKQAAEQQKGGATPKKRGKIYFTRD